MMKLTLKSQAEQAKAHRERLDYILICLYLRLIELYKTQSSGTTSTNDSRQFYSKVEMD
jgi:hypothetical protein